MNTTNIPLKMRTDKPKWPFTMEKHQWSAEEKEVTKHFPVNQFLIFLPPEL